jgi:hypothetical protein
MVAAVPVAEKTEPLPEPEPEAKVLRSFLSEAMQKLRSRGFDTIYIGQGNYRISKSDTGPRYFFTAEGLTHLASLDDALTFEEALLAGVRRTRYLKYLIDEGATNMIKQPGQQKNKTTTDSEKTSREARAKKGATKGAAKGPAPKTGAKKAASKAPAPAASKKAATKAPIDQSARTAAVLAKITKAGKLEHRSLSNSTEKKIARQLMRDGVVKREAIEGVLTYIAK